MLPLPNLTKKDFETLFEEAKNRIPALTKEWTDFNHHDTGITMLQLFAWLFEMQHYYADAVGEEHQHKYLKLLGYTPRGQQPAKALIALKGIKEPMVFPRGTPFKAEDILFENSEAIRYIPNRMACILKGDHYLDITEIIKVYDESYETIWEPKESNCFYIGFENKLQTDEVLPIYVNIYKGKEKRMPLRDSQLRLAACKWELYTETGWKEILNVTDETNVFLQDGYIKLKPSLESSSVILSENYGPLHYLRCTLTENNYDILPRISYMANNIFVTEQKQTLAASFYLSSTGEAYQSYTLPHFLALTGELIVAVKRDETWEVWKNTEETPLYHMQPEKQIGVKIEFDQSLHKTVPEKGTDNIYIICYDKAFYPKRFIGRIEGYTNQQAVLKENELYQQEFKAAVMLDYKQANQLLMCQKVENLSAYSQLGREENCVYEVAANNLISFGEGIYHNIPKGISGNIIITDFALTKGKEGNVKEKKINRLSHEAAVFLPEAHVFNIKRAEGGKNRETIEEAINTFRKKFVKAERAITCEDYEEIVKQTPGLMIHKVRAISETKLYPDIPYSNKLCIIIKPYAEKEQPVLSSIYKKAIREHVENYRLLTTEIDIQSPIYLGIDVYGCIYIKKGYDGNGVYAAIKNAVDSIDGHRDFGEAIIFGGLFGQIETLESIAYIDNLSLEPIGYGGEKTLGGDIVIKPNVLTYLRSYHVELR